MSYQIHITRTAEQDLSESADYIEFVLKNHDAADHLLDLAAESIGSLADNPRIYSIVNDAVLHSWGIRYVVINNYMAFYTVDEESKIIFIVRFLYGKRDWISILKQGFILD